MARNRTDSTEEGEERRGKELRGKTARKESFGICNGVHLKVLSSHREQCDMADTVSFFL